MKYMSYVLMLPLIAWGCGNSGDPGAVPKKDTVVQNSPGQNEASADDKNAGERTPDFLALSKTVTSAYKGNLAGVDVSDSSGPFVIKEFFSDTLSFRMIFYPRNGQKDSVDFGSIARAADNNYQDYICFCFVYPMKDPEKMKDYHADNVSYPVDEGK
jgi:hypothetical protein